MDYAGHFLREVAGFEAATRLAVDSEAAPGVPSCPEWVVTDLALHLGMVHRWVSRIIAEQMQQPPEIGDQPWLGLAEEWRGWLPPGHAPQRSPVAPGLLDWFHDGAADLAERFRATTRGGQLSSAVRLRRDELGTDVMNFGGAEVDVEGEGLPPVLACPPARPGLVHTGVTTAAVSRTALARTPSQAAGFPPADH